jgi:DNA-binding MarR family transcriptional regulator
MEPDPVVQTRAEIAHAVRRLLRVVPDVHAALARDVGVGAKDLLALDHLSSAPSPEGVVDLGHRLGMTSASATVLVDRLVRAGHVTRAPHPTDGRRTTLALTGHAQDEVRAALTPLVADLASITDRLDDQQASAVLTFLEDLHRALLRFATSSEQRGRGSRPADGD